MLDDIDGIIISSLGKNARISSQEIAATLKAMGFSITDRAVRQRLTRLERRKAILGYSAILNPALVSDRVNRTFLVKFKFSKGAAEATERLTRYASESPFCIYAARLGGDMDFVCHFVFSSEEQYELETDNFVNRFSDLISDLRSYESKAIKSSPYVLHDDHLLAEKKLMAFKLLETIRRRETLNERLQATVDGLVRHFNASFARIWFVDGRRKSLVLKYSAGRYTNLHGEFSRIPLNSLKIGSIARTKKPVISNDIAHDPRIKHHDWARRERLRSFAGFPLLHRGEVVAVLAMFSTKSLTPAEFEVLSIFTQQASRDLSGFLEAKEFLAT